MVRSSDLSRGQTYHHATRPKTTKENKVWIPKTANASKGASVSERPAEPTCASNPEPVVYKIERNPAPTGTDAYSRRNACGAKHRAAPRGTDVAVNVAVRPSVVCLSGAEPNLRRPLGFGRGDAVRPQGIEERFRPKCPKDHSAAVRTC